MFVAVQTYVPTAEFLGPGVHLQGGEVAAE